MKFRYIIIVLALLAAVAGGVVYYLACSTCAQLPNNLAGDVASCSDQTSFDKLKGDDVVVVVNNERLTVDEMKARSEFDFWLLSHRSKHDLGANVSAVKKRLCQSSIQRFVMFSLWNQEAIRNGFSDYSESLEKRKSELCEVAHCSGSELYDFLYKNTGVDALRIKRWLEMEVRATAYQTFYVKNRVLILEKDVDDYVRRMGEIREECAASNSVYTAVLANAMATLDLGTPFETVAADFQVTANSKFPTRWGTFTFDELCNVASNGKMLAGWAFSAPIGSVSKSIYEMDDGRGIVRIANRSCRTSVFDTAGGNLDEDTVTLDRLAVKVWDAPELPTTEQARVQLYESRLKAEKVKCSSELVKRAKIDYPHGTKLW